MPPSPAEVTTTQRGNVRAAHDKTTIRSPRRAPSQQRERKGMREPAASEPEIAETIKRLTPEFAGQLSSGIIATVVRDSRRDLDTSPPTALPELLERHARQRLIDTLC